MKQITSIDDLPEDVRNALDVARKSASGADAQYARAYMDSLPEVVQLFGEDGARTQILYVLSNLNTWRGPAAREAKRVLRKFAGQ